MLEAKARGREVGVSRGAVLEERAAEYREGWKGRGSGLGEAPPTHPSLVALKTCAGTGHSSPTLLETCRFATEAVLGELGSAHCL